MIDHRHLEENFGRTKQGHRFYTVALSQTYFKCQRVVTETKHVMRTAVCQDVPQMSGTGMNITAELAMFNILVQVWSSHGNDTVV